MVQMGPNPGVPSPCFAINSFIYYFAHNFCAIIYYYLCTYRTGMASAHVRILTHVKNLHFAGAKPVFKKELQEISLVLCLSFLPSFQFLNHFTFWQKKPRSENVRVKNIYVICDT